MSNLFDDPNANFAFDMVSMEELSKQKSQKKEKHKFDPFNSKSDLIAAILVLLFVLIPMLS